MENLLDINQTIIFDESMAHYEIQGYQPYATSSFNNNDVIHIAIQREDKDILPWKSQLHIQGKVTQEDGTKLKDGTKLVNNPICSLFSGARYLINSIDIDSCKNIGITSLMKSYPSYNPNQLKFLEISGWNAENLIDDHRNFDVLVPLSMIFGFAEDYQKVVINAKHELILTRSNTDVNAIIQSAATAADNGTFKFNLTKIEWLMPVVTLSNMKKASLLKFLEQDPTLSMSFRS